MLHSYNLMHTVGALTLHYTYRKACLAAHFQQSRGQHWIQQSSSSLLLQRSLRLRVGGLGFRGKLAGSLDALHLTSATGEYCRDLNKCQWRIKWKRKWKMKWKLGLYWGNTGIMENQMETTVMENQMEILNRSGKGEDTRVL